MNTRGSGDADAVSFTVPTVAQKTYFSPKQNAKLREIAKRLKEELGSQEKVASHIGMTQPSFSAILIGKSGFSPKSAEALVRLARATLREYEHLTLESVLGVQGETSGKYMRGGDPYPNRELVIYCARQLGLDRRPVDLLQRVVPKDRKDRPCEWWLRRALAYVEIVRDESEITDPLLNK